MMEVLTNLVKELRGINWGSLIKWGAAVYFFFILSYFSDSGNGGGFYLFLIFSFLLFLIYGFDKQIADLKKKLEQKEKEWKAVDLEERLKALKSLERDSDL